MIKAGDEYEENAIRFFMSEYGVNPDGYTVVLKRKSGLHQTDGLTVPKDKKQYVIFLSPSAQGAELIRLIAHEVAHVCQIIKGDLEFVSANGSIKVFWHDEEVNVDRTPYRKRPWEVEAYTLEKKYVHDFINKYGNQLQENKMKTLEEYLTEGFPGNGIYIDEEKKIQTAFKPWEKFGKVTVASPKDDGEEVFNVKVHCTYPVSSAIINDLNKRVASKVTFSDSNMVNGSCEVGAGRAGLVLEFFVDFPS